MRIVFMGTPQFSVPILEALVNGGYNIVGVVTQPDRPKGRGQKVRPSPVKETALNFGLAVFQPQKVNNPDFLQQLENLLPDVIVVAAFGQILPPAILNLPRFGCINVHASLLPKYRGAAPIHWAIINGETKTGITTMLMNEGLDTGDILLQEAVPIAPDDTAGSLHDRLAGLGAKLLLKTLELLFDGIITPQPQDHSRATYAPLLTRKDEIIRWDQPAQSVFNLVRGMNPWPGACTFLNGQLLKIWQVEMAKKESLLTGLLPGQVRVAGPEEGLLVQACPGLVKIKELQLQGGKRINAADFLRGHNISVGIILEGEMTVG